MKFNTPQDRKDFINNYTPLVPKVVDKFLSEPKRWFQKDNKDLYMSSAYESLVKAADRFDETRGITFETYASNYIRAWLTKIFYVEIGYSHNNPRIEDLLHSRDLVEEYLSTERKELEDSEIKVDRKTDIIYKIYEEYKFKSERKKLLFKVRFIDELELEDIRKTLGFSTINSVRIALTKLKKELVNNLKQEDYI